MHRPQIEESLFKHLIQGVRDHAIFALDPEGKIITWNAGAQRIKGYTADEILGRHFSIFYTEEAKAIGHPAFELSQALKNGSYEEEGWRLRKDGSLFWANVCITAMYDDSGKHLGFSKVTRDLTERKAAQEASSTTAHALEASERVFDLMVNAVKDYAIFIMSPAGIIRTWNKGAERIKGYSANEIIGQHFSIFYDEQAKSSNHPAFELEQALKNGSYEEEGWRLRKDGSKFWAHVTITPIMGIHAQSGFMKVTRDLTEKKTYEAELEKSRDEAILANRLKSRFVANITHEIRTPLSGVVGLSELLAKNEALDSESHDAGVRIFEASQQLLTILNDLLDFAKLEAGKIELESVPFNVEKVVDDAVGLWRRKAHEKALSLIIDVDSALPASVVGDPNKLRQVLLNLVHNAIKFTESGGVEVSAEQQGDLVLFSVTDTGIGVDEEAQKRLFQPFTQEDESTARRFGGTGLGLSISQQFVELMSGTMGLRSKPGKGTTVWFTMPIKEPTGESGNGHH